MVILETRRLNALIHPLDLLKINKLIYIYCLKSRKEIPPTASSGMFQQCF